MASSAIDPTLDVQEVTLTEDDLKIASPFAMMIAGPSQSGKSELIFQLVKFRADVFSSDFCRIVYCNSNTYSPKNKRFIQRLQEEFPQVEIKQGLPDVVDLHLNLSSQPTLIIIDDLMKEVVQSSKMNDLVANDIHNFNLSVVFTFQNYFARGKHGNTLVKNCQYKVLFYNRIELMELRNISTQILVAPKFLEYNFNYLLKNYPRDPSHYILIDGHGQSKMSHMYCRTHIFPEYPGGEIKPLIFMINPNYRN